MESYLKRLKEDLEEFGDLQETITVRRADLEKLIQAYERLKEKQRS